MRLRRTRGPWRLTGLLGFLVLFAAPVLTAADSVEDRMRRDVTFLASDECEGRGVETKGIDKAADYIVAQFKQAGLKPGGPGGSWFQPFTIGGKGTLEAADVTLHGPQGQTIVLRADKDFSVMGFSGSGKVTAPVLFAGYGAVAKDIDYDDFKGLDVAGKVVIVLRHTPRWDNDKIPFDDRRKDFHASLETKLANAEMNRAAAVLFVNDRTELPKGDALLPFSYLSSAGAGSIPTVQVRYDLADSMIRSGLGTGLRDLEGDISRDLQPRSAPLKGWSATIRTDVPRPQIACKNVIGVLEGSGPLAKETIVVGAHYDHLGYGGPSSLAKNKNEKAIHHGADDNGSGTTAILELARRFGAMDKRQGRRLVFMAFSAEERGLLGSRYYCNKAPLFALADTAAMVNLDMVGRLRQDPKTSKDKLIVEGVGTAKTFATLVDELNKKHGFQLVKKTEGLGPSDHDSFCRHDVPVLFLWTGYHDDYHRPSDTSDKINVAGMARVAALAQDAIANLASAEKRPEYVYLAPKFQPTTGGKGKGMPPLGIMPSYEDEQMGVLLDGVAVGGPAAAAGLKAGDRILEINGKAVPNVNVYMAVMAQQKIGQAVEIRYVRAGKSEKAQVTPK